MGTEAAGHTVEKIIYRGGMAMGTLGKELFDANRPRTYPMVRFGERECWVENRRERIPYGVTLIAPLDADVGTYQESLARLREAVDSGSEYTERLKTANARLRELPYFNLFLRENIEPELAAWSRGAERLRDKALRAYERASDAEDRRRGGGEAKSALRPQANIFIPLKTDLFSLTNTG